LGEVVRFVKVFDQGGIIVGVLIIAPHAGEMIAEAALAVKLKLKIEDVQSVPTQHFRNSFLKLLGMLITTQSIYFPENKDPMHNRRKRIW
jgi:hypothetical protein